MTPHCINDCHVSYDEELEVLIVYDKKWAPIVMYADPGDLRGLIDYLLDCIIRTALDNPEKLQQHAPES